MENFKESLGKKTPPAKSVNELMNLLMKLNDKLREKISPVRKKKENELEKTDVVIIIMSNQAERVRSSKTSRTAKTESPQRDWIQDLCQDIERGSHPRGKS